MPSDEALKFLVFADGSGTEDLAAAWEEEATMRWATTSGFRLRHTALVPIPSTHARAAVI